MERTEETQPQGVEKGSRSRKKTSFVGMASMQRHSRLVGGGKDEGEVPGCVIRVLWDTGESGSGSPGELLM